MSVFLSPMVEVNTSYQLFGAAMSVSGLFEVYILTPLQAEVWGDHAGTDPFVLHLIMISQLLINWPVE